MKSSAFLILAAITLTGCGNSNDTPDPLDGDSTTADSPSGQNDPTQVETPPNQPDQVPVDNSIAAISLDNYVGIVSTVFNAYTGNSYGPAVVSLPGYSDPAYQNTLQITDAIDSVVCSNGGTGELSTVTSGDRVITKITNFEFNNCQDGDNLLEGTFNRTLDDNMDVSSSGLVVTEPSTTKRFSGNAFISQGNEYGGGPGRFSWYTGFDNQLSYSEVDTENVFVIDNAETVFERVLPFSASLRGKFLLKSVDTGNHTLTVQSSEDFEFDTGGIDGPNWDRRDNWNFDSGALTITADDGSSLSLDAGNGNFDTVTVTITSGGQTEQFDEPWTTWSDLLITDSWLYDGNQSYIFR